MANYTNPVLRGFFPDPSVIRVGNDYYMVNSSFQYFPAIPISHSTDLVHWHIIGHAITDNSYLNLSDLPCSHGIWAPDIAYINGKYFIIATLRLAGRGTRGNNVLRRQIIVHSLAPEGPYSKPDFIEVDDIDPSLFVDNDGTAYMAIAPGVRLVKLSPDLTKAESEPITIWEGTGERCAEGPHVMFHEGYYYAIVASGGTGYGHGINCARSKTLFGHYENSPYNPVMRQTDAQALLQRAGHGKLVQAADKSWWCYYLCARGNEGRFSTCGRETALDPVEWTHDGWFTINYGKGPSAIQQAPLITTSDYTGETGTCYKDDFDSPNLDLQWEFVRNPDMFSCSLSQRPGFFRVYTQNGKLNELCAKNTLVMREKEHKFTATTLLDFNPTRNGEQAGIVCYYSISCYIRFCVCFEKERAVELVVSRGAGSQEVLVAHNKIPEGMIRLRVQVCGQKRTFSFATVVGDFLTVGTVENCTFLSDEGVPNEKKRHTACLTGIYANNGGCDSRIACDFDYFIMQY